LTKTITSPENQTSQRRFAPIVIAEGEIVDRFQMKSVIVFVKIRSIVIVSVRHRARHVHQVPHIPMLIDCRRMVIGFRGER